MGFSVTISHAILLIAAIIVASSFAFVMIAKTSTLSSIFSQNINQLTINSQLDFTFVYAYYNSVEGAFYVYLKNTGLAEIPGSYIAKSDLIIISNNKAQLIIYGDTKPGYWIFQDTNGISGWQIGETVVIKAYNQTAVDLRMVIKFVLPSGLAKDYYVWLGD
ncbi:MAG: flagellin [Fervidicoccaceae archaeon]|nr:flagellin [Fervidicoccaceae archaeon]